MGFASGVSCPKTHTTFVTTHAHTDTVGQERYHSLVPMYCRHANAIVFGFDVTDRRSFDGCDRWIDELSYCVDQECVRAAVGNKIDLKDRREVSTEEARKHFESMEPPVLYFETSAKTGEGVDELFEAVARFVLERKTDSMNNNNPEEGECKKDSKCTIC